MDTTEAFVLVAVTALSIVLVILVAMGRTGHRHKRFTPLAGLAFGCVIAGVAFGQNRRIAYSLLGAGVLLSVVDALLRVRDRL